MNLAITILGTVVIFSVLVLVHEFGHFWIAKRQKIQVLEFGIGFPPRLFGKKIGDTVYSVNLIPFGGFVKMYGEDSHDPRTIANHKSYPSKRPWQRAKVAFGGVLMNFLLAWILLAAGFTFGMEPLIADYDDVMTHINSGAIDTEAGVFVKEVKKDSLAEIAGFQKGDKIIAIDSKEVFSYEQLKIFLALPEKFSIATAYRNNQSFNFEIPADRDFGVELHPNVFLPRLTIVDVAADSPFARAGLRAGDIILSVNDSQIFGFDDYDAVLNSAYVYRFTVLRGHEKVKIDVSLPNEGRVYIDGVFPDSAASKSGFNKGDILLSINGKDVISPQEAREIISENKESLYRLKHAGSIIEIKAKPDSSGILGVALSSISNFQNYKLTFAETPILSSITEISKLKYPVHQAVYFSLREGVKLAKVTALMFADTLRSIVGSFEVSEAVGGPVRIASLTGIMIKDGMMAVIRFVALLSLSLGVINLFPLPALDGGRLVFIFVEMLRGKPINPRFESWIHLIGFVFLLLLIVAITYHDILRLISS